jgi:hypothetical protein
VQTLHNRRKAWLSIVTADKTLCSGSIEQATWHVLQSWDSRSINSAES